MTTREIGSCTTQDQLAIDAERYAAQVLEDVDLEIESEIEWEASGQLTASNANIRRVDDDRILAKVSWKAYKNRPWEVVENAVRWCLVRAVKLDNPQMTDMAFRSLERELDVPAFDQPPQDPKYVLTCQNCGHEYKRQTRSKIVKNPDRYTCQCGGSLEVTKGR